MREDNKEFWVSQRQDRRDGSPVVDQMLKVSAHSRPCVTNGTHVEKAKIT